MPTMVARSRELHGRWLHGLSNVCVRGETRSSEHSSTDEHHISALLELLPHRGTRSSCQTCREHQDSRRLVVSSTWCRLACMHSSGCAAAWNRALNGRLTCLLRADGDAPTQSTTRVRKLCHWQVQRNYDRCLRVQVLPSRSVPKCTWTNRM